MTHHCRPVVSVRSFAAAPAVTEDASSGVAPTVFDKIISLTIVDPSGARRKINGMVGKYDVHYKFDFFHTFGYAFKGPLRKFIPHDTYNLFSSCSCCTGF
jgi:hypothetical protein